MMFPIYRIIFICSISMISAQDEWVTIGTQQSRSISGVANLNGNIFLVHDNKKANEERIGLLRLDGDSVDYRTVDWPVNDLPYDLEALTAIPNSLTDMIAMESQGKCHWLIFDKVKQRLAYNGCIQLPGVKYPTNLEGFDLIKSGKKYLAVWGHRGKTTEPGKLYWGWMDLNHKTVHPLDSLEISVDWPTEYVRHIADIKIDQSGNCWISATSDPGDEGPFSSALYQIGTFRFSDNRVQFYLEKHPSPIFKFENRKVEGFELISGGILVATDDEYFGGYIKRINLGE